jgi:general secretion pathway protein G
MRFVICKDKRKMTDFIKKKTSGFTLIELMVVMAIISVLLGLTMTGFLASRKTARDGKRKSDLEQIRSALEMCYSDTSTYPGDISSGVICGTKEYLNPLPADPSPSLNYFYSSSGTTYILCASLETGSGGVPSGCGSCGSSACNYKVTNP